MDTCYFCKGHPSHEAQRDEIGKLKVDLAEADASDAESIKMYNSAREREAKKDLRIRDMELQIDELRDVIHGLQLFVGVYEGRVLDKARATELVNKHGLRNPNKETSQKKVGE